MRVVVITGGTAGVGRACARRFARSGDAVAVLARGADRIAATVAEIEALGGRALGLSVDVADADAVDLAAAAVERELGAIDVWINNAMVTAFGPFETLSPAEFARVTDVTYHGYVWGTRAALARMRPRGRGTIIQIGSAVAYRSIPLQSAYSGAKHAINGFTDAIRSELRRDHLPIRLCTIQLPAVDTPQFAWCENKLARAARPIPPVYEPEVIADVVHRVAAHPRREVFVGTSAIKAIVGTKLAPGLLDRYLAARGYDGQLADEPNPHAPSNLFVAVPGDRGSRGQFSHGARTRDVTSRIAAVLGAAGVQAVLVGAIALAFVAIGARLRRLA